MPRGKDETAEDQEKCETTDRGRQEGFRQLGQEAERKGASGQLQSYLLLAGEEGKEDELVQGQAGTEAKGNQFTWEGCKIPPSSV
jgi:hypothetical protein